MYIPLVKERINLTSNVGDRKRFVNAEYKDLVALEKVLQYIYEHHRKEDKEFLKEILHKVPVLFSLQDMNEVSKPITENEENRRELQFF